MHLLLLSSIISSSYIFLYFYFFPFAQVVVYSGRSLLNCSHGLAIVRNH